MPFLDEWAKGGVDFENAYTPNPTCMPARVSMMTGRYSECHQVRTNHNLQDALYTEDLLDVLKKNGYVTALCGKNHSHRSSEDFDFHECTGHLGNEGEVNTTPAECEFADFLNSTHHMEMHVPSPGGVEVQHPYRNVSSAFQFIDSLDHEPFFAWVSFAEPHNPYQVPEPYFDMFPPEQLPPLHSTTEKQGMLALTFADKDDYDKIRENDHISIIGLKEFTPGKPLTAIVLHADGTQESFPVNHTYNDLQIRWFKSGSALNMAHV